MSFYQTSALDSDGSYPGYLPNRLTRSPVQQRKRQLYLMQDHNTVSMYCQPPAHDSDHEPCGDEAQHLGLHCGVHTGCEDTLAEPPALAQLPLQSGFTLPYRCSAPSVNLTDCDPCYRAKNNTGRRNNHFKSQAIEHTSHVRLIGTEQKNPVLHRTDLPFTFLSSQVPNPAPLGCAISNRDIS